MSVAESTTVPAFRGALPAVVTAVTLPVHGAAGADGVVLHLQADLQAAVGMGGGIIQIRVEDEIVGAAVRGGGGPAGG